MCAFRSRATLARASIGRHAERAKSGAPSACARRSATSSRQIRSASRRAARASSSSAGWGSRPIAVRTRNSSSYSSTGAPCATRRSRARSGRLILDFLPPDRHAVPRPVRRMRAGRSRRQRASGQGRGALSQFGPGARARRLRDQERLSEALHRAATTGGTATILAMRPQQTYRSGSSSARWDWRASPAAPRLYDAAQASFAELAPAALAPAAPADERDLAAPLGAARAQVHGVYIIAQTNDGVVIVDQHAAHERIVYEKLKRERDGGRVERQALLSPLVVDLDPDAAALFDGARRGTGRAWPCRRGLRPRRGPGARSARGDRSRAILPASCAISPPTSRRRTARAAPGAPARSLARDIRLPALGARREGAPARRDERASARDGNDAGRRPMQPRPPDLCRAQARRHRAAVRAKVGGRSSDFGLPPVSCL